MALATLQVLLSVADGRFPVIQTVLSHVASSAYITSKTDADNVGQVYKVNSSRVTSFPIRISHG